MHGHFNRVRAVGLALALSGCAGMVVADGPNPRGFTFYDPLPHLLVTVSGDCIVTSQVVALPGKPRSLRFKGGYGSADLSAAFSNGLLTSIGQKTDSKVPETLGAVASLATAAAGGKGFVAPAPAPKPCPNAGTAHLYPIDANGNVDRGRDKLGGH